MELLFIKEKGSLSVLELVVSGWRQNVMEGLWEADPEHSFVHGQD